MAFILLISPGYIHRQLEHTFEGDGVDIKPPSWLPVALEYTGGHSKASSVHSWPEIHLAMYEREWFCFLTSSLES